MPQEQSTAGVGPDAEGGKQSKVVSSRLKIYAQLLALFVVLCGVVGFHYVLRGFHKYPVEPDHHVPVADASRGPARMRDYGCIGCHTVPGVPGADGRVGPRLDRLWEKSYVAGVLPNSPQNLVVWIQHPQEVDPRTAMPDLGVTEQDARDIAAYLYSLR